MFTGIITCLSKILDIDKKFEDWICQVEVNFIPKIGESIAIDGICLTVTSVMINQCESSFNESFWDVQGLYDEGTLKNSMLSKNNDSSIITFVISSATRKVTNTIYWKNGSLLNTERSMQIGDRLDGHFVLGHIDCLGEIIALDAITLDSSKQSMIVDSTNKSHKLRVKLPKSLLENDQKILKNDEFSFSQFVNIFNYIVYKGSITLNGISFTINLIDLQNHFIEVNIIPHTYNNTNLQYCSLGSFLNVEFDILGKYVNTKIVNKE